MVAAELTFPSSVHDLLVRERDADALVVTLSHDLPPGGVAAGRLRGRFHLTGSTWRLLDSPILAAAGEVVKQNYGRKGTGWPRSSGSGVRRRRRWPIPGIRRRQRCSCHRARSTSATT